MELALTTPALLFPAISLLLLAYTQRFLTLAALTRELYARHRAEPDPSLKGQLLNLRHRIGIIRNMQIFGVASFFLCALCMFLLFAGLQQLGTWVFGASLVCLLISLGLSLRELVISIDALMLQISDLDEIEETVKQQAAEANATMDVRLGPTLQFLDALKDNNNTRWFHVHRAEYDAARAAFELLVEEVILQFNRIEDLGGVQPRDCMFRINRDVRFRRDKSPYRVNMGALIARGGRKSPRGAYYIHVQPRESFVAGGAYMPDAAQLNQIRSALVEDGASFRAILKRPAFKRAFGALDNDDVLKNVPKGFDPADPVADLLRYKRFTASHRLSDAEMRARDVPKDIVALFRALKPMNDWLNKAMGV